ncbi:MFS domain-containing protein [Fusarium falciforme]|uniref:MFS domain-containing protein n=1 Tax=Fusarium falciforme TaxID=195108 RepID=UPI0023005781|nr:MFS domain-containing protein [Fusarium falciforme]WAO91569.1 MFS domain-containing protein [Fusarium falciforme]
MVFLWNSFYDIGPANMGYAITSEVSSGRMRVKNNAFVHVGSHLTGFALSYAVPYMYNPDAGNLGLRMGLIWGSFSVIFVIWSFVFIPDVTGLSFYQIDQLFESRGPVRKFHQAKFDDNGLLIRSFSTRTSGGLAKARVYRWGAIVNQGGRVEGAKAEQGTVIKLCRGMIQYWGSH